MSHPLIDEFENKLNKDLDFLQQILSHTRTGRANPSLIAHLQVECYGSKTPLEQVARISVEGNSSLQVSPWDQNNIDSIEAEIRNSDLGLNPARSGTSIRVPIPPLTGERREALIKNLNAEAENCRIAIRNHRRDVLGRFKNMVKEGEISEDEDRALAKQVEGLVKGFIDKVDKSLEQKTTEIAHI